MLTTGEKPIRAEVAIATWGGVLGDVLWMKYWTKKERNVDEELVEPGL